MTVGKKLKADVSYLIAYVTSGGSVQLIVRDGTRQEAHRSLSELCSQNQSDFRQLRNLESVQVGGANGNLRQFPVEQHCE
jgi:hypothetical protein